MTGGYSGDKPGSLNLGGPSIEWEQQVSLEVQVAGLTNGLNSCEREKGDKDDSQVYRTNPEDKDSISNSLNSVIFSEITFLAPGPHCKKMDPQLSKHPATFDIPYSKLHFCSYTCILGYIVSHTSVFSKY